MTMMSTYITIKMNKILKFVDSYFQYYKLKGYKKLLRSAKIKSFNSLHHSLSYNPFESHSTSFVTKAVNSFLLNGLTPAIENVAFNQYLTRRIGFTLINRFILFSYGRFDIIFFPGPRLWQKKVSYILDLRVSYLLSTILYILFALFSYFSTFREIFLLLNCHFKAKKGISLQPYSYMFPDLRKNNLPYKCATPESNIFLFLDNQELISREFPKIAIYTNEKKFANQYFGYTFYSYSHSFPLLTRIQVFRLLSWGFIATFVSFVLAFCLNLKYLIFFKEALIAYAFTLTDANNLPKGVFYSQSSYIYRPLWTHVIEKRGIKTYLFFYATNIQSLQKYCPPYPPPYGYSSMTWSNYIVWSCQQSQFIASSTLYKYPEKKYYFGLKPVPLQSKEKLIQVKPKTIAVFDVTPHCLKNYAELCSDLDYYIFETSLTFLSDIFDACKELSLSIIFKQKRNIGSFADKRYINLISNYSKEPNFTIIDPETSSFSLINATLASVSQPFTSTALIGESISKPACFYDPGGLLYKPIFYLEQVPLLNSKALLYDWLRSLV